jgi:hypothetical protein
MWNLTDGEYKLGFQGEGIWERLDLEVSRTGNEGEPIYGLLVEGRRERGHRFLVKGLGAIQFCRGRKGERASIPWGRATRRGRGTHLHRRPTTRHRRHLLPLSSLLAYAGDGGAGREELFSGGGGGARGDFAPIQSRVAQN